MPDSMPAQKGALKASSERQALLLQSGVEDGSRAMDPGRAGSEHTFYRFLAFDLSYTSHFSETLFSCL